MRALFEIRRRHWWTVRNLVRNGRTLPTASGKIAPLRTEMAILSRIRGVQRETESQPGAAGTTFTAEDFYILLLNEVDFFDFLVHLVNSSIL